MACVESSELIFNKVNFRHQVEYFDLLYVGLESGSKLDPYSLFRNFVDLEPNSEYGSGSTFSTN